MDDPQLTSKVVFSRVKQALLVEQGFVRDAACTTCDLLLITKNDFSWAWCNFFLRGRVRITV